MATKTNELPIAQSAGLTDHAIVDTAGGTVRLPLKNMPAAGMLTTTTLTNVDFNALELGKVVNISYPTGDGDGQYHSPLGELESKTDVTWYVVETFGVSNRVMQIAHAPFRMHRRSFVRYSHDGTWSKWMEFAATEQICNDNLLDNTYWAERSAIINQRGKTEYSGVGYTIDRLYAETESCVLKIGDGYIEFRSGVFVQKTERPYPVGTVLTLSALTDDNRLFSKTGKVTSAEQGAVTQFVIDNSIIISVSYYSGSNYQNLRIAVGNTPLRLKAAKLESGYMQTLAHEEGTEWVLNGPRPNPALELIKCQRHQLKLLDSGGNYGGAIGYGFCQSATEARICIPTPATMRGRPAFTWLDGIVGSLILIASGESHAVTSITTASGNYNNQVFFLVSAENLPAGSPCMLKVNSPSLPILDANI